MKNKLVFVLNTFSYKDIIEIENNDTQYIAIKKLYTKIQNKLLFQKLVIINALLSYQLNMSGEEYWQIFSDFFVYSKNINDFPIFIKQYNKRFINTKLIRYKKIRVFIDSLSEKKLIFYCNNLLQFNKDLSRHLNQISDAKTIVFTIKMFIYSLRIIYKKNYFAPHEIFIPIDSRLKKINSDKKFWIELLKEVEIPPLHIDSILWIYLGNKSFIESLNPNLRNKFIELNKIISII